jgi:hypothetical protein
MLSLFKNYNFSPFFGINISKIITSFLDPHNKFFSKAGNYTHVVIPLLSAITVEVKMSFSVHICVIINTKSSV